MKTNWQGIVIAFTAFTALSTTTTVQAQHGNDGLMTYLQREFERSTSMLNEFFNQFPQEQGNDDQEEPIQVLVIQLEDEPTPTQPTTTLTTKERQAACQVAVKHLEEQQALKQEAEHLHSRLRSSLQHAFSLVSYQFEEKTRCENLERPELIEECYRVLNMDTEITKYLQMKQTKEQICSVIQQNLPSVDPPLSCKLCKRFVQMVDDAIEKDLNQVEQVREILGDICDSMAADSMCHNFLKQYDDVVNWIKQGTDPSLICSRLRMCTASSTPLEETSLIQSVEHNAGCLFCTHVAGAVRGVNKWAPDQIDSLHKIVTGVCKTAPKCFHCNDTEANFDKIVTLVKQGKHPREICKSLNLCKKKPAEHEFMELLMAEPIAEETAIVLLETDGLKDEKTCFYCDYVTTVIEVLLQEAPDQVSQVRSFVDMICDTLGDDNQCHKYVKDMDFVIDGLTNGKKPRELCTSLKFCTVKSTALPAPPSLDLVAFKQTLMQHTNTQELAIDSCFFCTQVTTILQIALAQNPDQIEKIRQIADLVCKMMPAENKCHAYVNSMDEIIDSLHKGEEPASICKDLKYCKASDALSLPAFIEHGKTSNTCAYCDGVVTVLSFAIQQKPDQVNEIREAAGIVCELLPEDDQCHNDIKIFDQAVTELKAGKSPHVVCHDLKFCNSTQLTSPSIKVDLTSFQRSSIGSNCAKCQQNPLLLAAVATNPHGVKTFQDILSSVCRLIADANECDMLMRHRSVIQDGLAKNQNMETICARTNECDSTADSKAVVKESVEDKTISIGCLFCDYTAEILTRIGNSPSEIQLAKKALGTMCTILPPLAKCDVLSSKFDQLAQLIQQGKSPTEACAAIALCAADELTSENESPVMKQTAALLSVDRD